MTKRTTKPARKTKPTPSIAPTKKVDKPTRKTEPASQGEDHEGSSILAEVRAIENAVRSHAAIPQETNFVPTKTADESIAITMREYGALEAAFEYLNTKLFGGRLPDAMFNYTRKPHMLGHFAVDRYSGRVGQFKKPEIALNPDSFIGRTDEQIVSTLAHEMKHLEQHYFGNPGSRGYHNKAWAASMKAIGLMPSNTGAVGGKETGQQMSHYIIPNGAFARAFAELAANGWKLNLQSTIYAAGASKKKKSKTTYICKACEINAWGKPNLGLVCKDCLIGNVAKFHWLDEDKAKDLGETINSVEMLPEQAEIDDPSYDQAAE